VSLESKAKTIAEFYHAWFTGKLPQETPLVPLEEAQKLDRELQQAIGFLEKATYTADIRGEQIAEANKVREEFPIEYFEPLTKEDEKVLGDWLKHLREALSLTGVSLGKEKPKEAMKQET
jgi:hypothetical protein